LSVFGFRCPWRFCRGDNDLYSIVTRVGTNLTAFLVSLWVLKDGQRAI
jgi:hypothetical protein